MTDTQLRTGDSPPDNSDKLDMSLLMVAGVVVLGAGLLLAPQGFGAMITMPIAGILADRIGPGKIVPAGITVIFSVILTNQIKASDTAGAYLASRSAQGDESVLAMAAVMALVLVVVPLLLVRGILTRHTYVSDEAVSVVTGSELRQQIAFDDLTEIRVRYSGQGGRTLRNEKVFLSGPLRTGSGTVLVSRFCVDSLQPLLQRLAAEVAERPELLQGEVEREYVERALTTAP